MGQFGTGVLDQGRLASGVRRRLRRLRQEAGGAGERALGALGMRHSEERLTAEAGEFWADHADPAWRDNSHWRGGSKIDDRRFDEIGRDHLALFDRLAGTAGGRADLGCVLEWGVGGGANAVHFAPRAERFVAVDVNPASPAETASLVASRCDTPVTEVVIDVAEPEAARDHVPARGLDVFLCLYVLELVPSPEYGLDLMRLAAEMLRPGGLAFVQIKYHVGPTRADSPRRNYRHHTANMTTYRLDHFWTTMDDLGLRPLAMTLVPENALDRNYGYFLLQRGEHLPTGPSTARPDGG